MLRRRRPRKNEAIHFSFDAFLDLVTNIVGIIIRLILVTWVGARAYHASMQWVETQPEAPTEQLPPPKISDDPLYSKMGIAKNQIEDARARLLAQLKEVEAVNEKSKTTEAQLLILSDRRAKLESERKDIDKTKSNRGAQVQLVSLSVDEIRQRTRKLLDEIKTLEARPAVKKEFKYHAPVSQAVRSDEVHFECKNGRVTFIDLPAFLMEVRQSMDGITLELRNQWKVERTTAPVGRYQMRYVVERERSPLDGNGQPAGNYFRASLSRWDIDPITPDRGETLQRALQPGSEFRQLADPLDGNLTTVTFWVYPESFEMFRQLRDYLYERGLDVAGRPLPSGASIAGSRHGSASRGQ